MSGFRPLICLVVALTLATSHECGAEQPLVIRSDRGGLIDDMMAQVAQLRDSQRRVEIRGTCLSACTLLLALDTVCVAPRARLGFHGPSSYGRPLHPNDFERWSQEIAAHYLPPLRRWYMETGRHRLKGYYRLRGDQLIELGYPAC